jgi:hypothetical protein
LFLLYRYHTVPVEKEIPVKFEEPVAESKPWISETDWKLIKYGAIGTAEVITLAAVYILGRSRGYSYGLPEQVDGDYTPRGWTQLGFQMGQNLIVSSKSIKRTTL